MSQPSYQTAPPHKNTPDRSWPEFSKVFKSLRELALGFDRSSRLEDGAQHQGLKAEKRH
jgi:hypothetical protein